MRLRRRGTRGRVCEVGAVALLWLLSTGTGAFSHPVTHASTPSGLVLPAPPQLFGGDGPFTPLGPAPQGSDLESPIPPPPVINGTWNDVFPPEGRLRHTAVYDPVRDRMIVIGGGSGAALGDVWAFALSGSPQWTPIVPTGTAPSARYGHSAIYDRTRDRVIIFGGIGLGWPTNDVWELTLTGTPAWRQLLPAGPPPIERADHSAIYDPLDDRMIIFGGYHPYGFRNDAWSLSLAGATAWSPINPSGPLPDGRYGHVAIYDPLRDRMLMSGGYGSETSRQETWSLSLGESPSWSLLGAGTPSIASVFWSAIYDSLRDRLVVFGGGDGNNSSSRTNRVAVLALAGSPAWDTLAIPPPRPLPRGAHTSIYDPVRDRMVVFGGGVEFTCRDDVWSLAFGPVPAWSVLRPPGGAPTGRFLPSAIEDPLRGRMLVFGGWSGEGLNADVWAFSLGTPAWSEVVVPGPHPTRRYGQSAVYDATRDRLLVFGGEDDSVGFRDDTWSLSLTSLTWSSVATTGPTPSPRSLHTAIYDPVGDRMLVFGGYQRGPSFGDLWELSLSGTPTWTQMAVGGGAPDGRAGHSALYDAARHRMLVFGGWDGTRYRNDVWALSLPGTPSWSMVQMTGPPPTGRTIHVAVLDSRQDRMVVFGGIDSSTYANGGYLEDAHALALSGIPRWRPLATDGNIPMNRGGASAIYDPRGHRMILFGGYDGGSRFFDDVAELVFTPFVVSAPPFTPAGAQLAVHGFAHNPASADPVVAFSIPADGPVRLEVFDLAGRRIHVQVAEGLGPGTHRLRIDAARSLANGVYALRITQGGRVAAGRGIVLR